jgi:hypothetical protein
MYFTLFVMNILLTVFRYFIVQGESGSFHVAVSVASLVGFWGLWEFVLFIGTSLEKSLPIILHPNSRIIIQVVATFLLATLYGVTLFHSSIYFFDVHFPPSLQEIGYLLYFLLSVVLNLIYFGTHYFFHWKKELVNLANMQREQAMVKYDALRNQLNPHFLFNALTSLNSLIFDNQQLASDFLQQLSKVYRYVLQHKEKQTVSLSTELDFVDSYTFLLKTRFGSGIEVNSNLNEQAKEKHIVPATLQILIENAVKHNIISSANPLIISITECDSYLLLKNNVNKKAQVETSNKQGLENLKSLYRYLIDKPIDIVETNEIFTIKIPLI